MRRIGTQQQMINQNIESAKPKAAASVTTMRLNRLFEENSSSTKYLYVAALQVRSFLWLPPRTQKFRPKRSSNCRSFRAEVPVRLSQPRLPSVHIVRAIERTGSRKPVMLSWLDAGTPVSLSRNKEMVKLQWTLILAKDSTTKLRSLLNEGITSQPQPARNQLYGYLRSLPKDDSVRSLARRRKDALLVRASLLPLLHPSPQIPVSDQTKGAKLSDEWHESHDVSTVVRNMVSSAHAVLHYTQQSLGATFSSRNCSTTITPVATIEWYPLFYSSQS
jgi:hypothetical protein